MIMLIEDSKIVCKNIMKLMPQFDYVIAESKYDLMNKLSFLSNVDLIISDINLNGDNGLDLCLFIKSLFPCTPVVVLSSLCGVLDEHIEKVNPLKVYDKSEFSKEDFVNFVQPIVAERLVYRNLNQNKINPSCNKPCEEPCSHGPTKISQE